jgi:periplasmic protein TonB
MSQDLFHDVTDRRPRATGARGGTLAVSIAAHALILAGVIVVPLLATDILPMPTDRIGDYVDVVRPPEVPPAPSDNRTRVTTPQPRANSFPVEAPDTIVDEGPRPPVSDAGMSVVGATGLNTGEGVLGSTGDAVPQPPTPPPPAPVRPVRVGGVSMPAKVHDVAPVYPRIARDAHVEGVVIIEAVIAVDGSVRDARVLRSQPLLDGAALDAVKQWRYAPTRLNGVAVPVIVTVTVQFRLQR